MSRSSSLRAHDVALAPYVRPAPAAAVLRRKCECGSHTPGGATCAECGGKRPMQAKLAIGSSDDALEVEANRVADQVMAGKGGVADSGAAPRIQRYSGGADAGMQNAPASVERVLAGSGQPLPAPVRADMEQRFGRDFSIVRLHADGAAAHSARQVGARAYTTGSDIVFGAGQFAPHSAPGRHLLAHELTHVVQQSGATTRDGVVQRDPLEDERRRQAMRSQMKLPPGVAEKWGIAQPSAAPAAGAHASPPGLEPKPQPRTLEEVIAASNVDPHRSAKPAADAPIGDAEVMRMTGAQRLGAAVTIARNDNSLSADIKAEIDALFTPQALAGMAVFAGLYLASQVTPAGWVADAIALTTLTIAAVFMGSMLFQILKDAGTFLSALNATTWVQLTASGHALTRALAKIAVALLVALITRTVKGAAKSYSGPPPPPNIAEAVTAEGFVVRMPAAAAVPQVQSPALSMAGHPGAVAGVVTGAGPAPKDKPEPPKSAAAKGVRADGLRPNEVALLKKARKSFNLPDAPTPENQRIVGVLIPEGQAPIEIHSGAEGGPSGGLQRGDVPRGPGTGLDRYTSGHVEGHAAAIMRQRGFTKAVLLIEKYFCPNCDRNFPQTLPKGSQVLVVFPDSAELVNSSEM